MAKPRRERGAFIKTTLVLPEYLDQKVRTATRMKQKKISEVIREILDAHIDEYLGLDEETRGIPLPEGKEICLKMAQATLESLREAAECWAVDLKSLVGMMVTKALPSTLSEARQQRAEIEKARTPSPSSSSNHTSHEDPRPRSKKS